MVKYGFMMFALVGCWVNSLFIKNLDNLIEAKVSSRLHLYQSQKEKLEKDLSIFLSRLQNLAPIALKKLDSYQEWAKKGEAKPEKILKEIEYWQGVYLKQMEELASKHIDYLAGLDQKQQEHFFKESEEKNKELAERIEERDMDQIFKRYEFYTKDLNKDQRDFLKKEKDFFFRRDRERLKSKKDFQKKLKALFSAGKDPKAFQKLAQENLSERFSQDRNRKHAEIIAALLEKADKKSQKSLLKRLSEIKDWVKTFEKANY